MAASRERPFAEESLVGAFDRRSAILGTLLLFLFVGIAAISPSLKKSQNPSGGYITAFMVLYAASGTLFLLQMHHLKKQNFLMSMKLLVGVGILLRLTMLFSTPILEDDFHRYLLDGAIVASGQSPYLYAPIEIAEARDDVPAEVVEIGRRAPEVLDKINFPAIRTIYPPVAQGLFAISHFISPFAITGLRLVLLLFDGAAFVLLLIILTRLKKNSTLSLFYWWNPIVAKELINACHMDALLLPFLLGALYLLLEKRWLLSTLMIVLSTGVKLWPVIFLPFVAVHLLRSEVDEKLKRRGLLLSGGLVIGLGALMVWPIVLSSPDETSGFLTYTFHWRNNDAVYRLLMIPMQPLMQWIGRTVLHAYLMTRFLVAGIYLALVAVILHRLRTDDESIVTAWLLVVALLFFFSPTQFPWYFTWVIPFLAVRSWPALTLYIVALPLYYAQYVLPRGEGRFWFDNLIIWVEHLPVFGAIAITHFRRTDSPLELFSRKGETP